MATARVVITVAPTGAEVTRANNPNIPYSPEEIAEEAIGASREGAAVAHLHVRKDDGTPAADAELFQRTIAAIRTGSEMLTMVSTGGAVWMTMEERMTGIEADPDVIGIEVESLNFDGDPFITSNEDIRKLAAEADRWGKPLEIEAFDVGHVATGVRLIDEGVLPRGTAFNLVVGVPGGMPADFRGLQLMADFVHDRSPWGVTAIGRNQTRMLAQAMMLGAQCIRVGFEDNVYLKRGVLAESNAALVRQATDVAEKLGFEIGNVDDARAYFGLS